MPFKKKGLNENPSLLEATMPQRLAFGSRLSEIPLRRNWDRNKKNDFSPEIKNKEILLSGKVEAYMQVYNPKIFSGMIVAHDNKKNGYGLFILNNKMHFEVNQNGKSFEIVSPQNLPSDFTIKSGMAKNGIMQLFINKKKAGNLKTRGLFSKDTEVTIRVGMETQNTALRIAEYPENDFRLKADMQVRLETLESNAAPVKEVAKIDKVITINVIKNVMKYDKQLISAKAGTTIKIVLKNPDFMQHNLVIIKRGTSEKVGAAADKLAQTGDGAKVSYVPKTPDVLAATPLINPNGQFTLTFKVPDIRGNYPYICTFPGHWRIMNGTLRVTK